MPGNRPTIPPAVGGWVASARCLRRNISCLEVCGNQRSRVLPSQLGSFLERLNSPIYIYNNIYIYRAPPINVPLVRVLNWEDLNLNLVSEQPLRSVTGLPARSLTDVRRTHPHGPRRQGPEVPQRPHALARAGDQRAGHW